MLTYAPWLIIFVRLECGGKERRNAVLAVINLFRRDPTKSNKEQAAGWYTVPVGTSGDCTFSRTARAVLWLRAMVIGRWQAHGTCEGQPPNADESPKMLLVQQHQGSNSARAVFQVG